MSALKDITGIQPIYFLPDDNLAQEVLIPCLSISKSFDCMVGYFSSRSFVQLAPGLASFLQNPDRTLRLIISPFLTQSDRQAIQDGLKTEDEVIDEKMAALLVSEEGLVRHTLRCLSYLIKHKRILIRIALMRDAQFHLKVWIVTDGNGWLAAHGSGNLTESGILKNYEQITISRSWIDTTQEQIVGALRGKFEALWGRKDPACRIYDLPDAFEKNILREYPVESRPTEEDYYNLVQESGGFLNERTWGYGQGNNDVYNNFDIPPYLSYREGDYAHQGRAVDAWCDNGFRGILEMATGSGKTITAMVAAKHLHRVAGKLFVLIAAPYLPLIDQWCEEVEPFGIRPINLTNASNSAGRRRLVSEAHRRLRHRRSDIEVLVSTHETLCDPDFIDALEASEAPMLLIADEMHNLGRESFISDPPEIFRYRLGLSATPVRQYDAEGTELLTEYFGHVVFRYTLQEAIGTCLVPYDYFVHCVYLTGDEIDNWLALTEKIRRIAWSAREDDSSYLEKLLRDRRLILEAAQNKIAALIQLLSKQRVDSIHHALIYATDKDPAQLDSVNKYLMSKGFLFHQLTANETRNKALMRRILKSFQTGDIKILTAKRVLDEGVNVPEITTAYILASTTVERQWVQRRGRVLRKCKAIGKEFATIHDFLVLPPTLNDTDDLDTRNLIKQELKRVMEFAGLARNTGTQGGALHTIDRVVNQFFGTTTFGG